jgi:16S rRNA processing protein RimM
VSGDLVYLELRGITSREAAAELQGAVLQVRREDAVTLPAGQFFWSDVIGLRVEDVAGASIGTVVDILSTGSNDVYVVRGELGEVLVPAIKDVVKEIAPEQGRVVVDLLPGLLPDAPAAAAKVRRRRGFRRGPRQARGGGTAPGAPSPPT